MTPHPRAGSRNLGRSSVAVFVAFIAVAILSLATDQILHVLNVYPPWGQPMFDPALNLLALSYRIGYTILGGYIAGRLAPRNPVRHAIVLGIVGLIVGSASALAVMSKYDLGPRWYPLGIALTAFPCSWLGGVLARRLST